jgi:hypothetical protein
MLGGGGLIAVFLFTPGRHWATVAPVKPATVKRAILKTKPCEGASRMRVHD